MRKYLFITLIVISCNSDYKEKKVNNAPSNFVTFEIYPSDNIAIRLPSKCTLIDSTSFGQRKTIISNKIIYSEDSSISLFILVQDFKYGSMFNVEDSSECKKYMNDLLGEVRSSYDSMYRVSFRSKEGWVVMLQKSIIKGAKDTYLGQVIALKDTKEINLSLKVSCSKNKECNGMIDTVLTSFGSQQRFP